MARALILAAGRGSRMLGLTDARPKCLLTVRGRALLDWQIEALREAGLSKIGIVTGYERAQLANRGLREFHNARWQETNMVASLATADAWLREDTCIVSYADIFYAPSAIASLLASEAPLAVTYDTHWLALWRRRFGDPLLDAETFRLTPTGALAEIGGRPRTVDEIEGQYMGLLRITPQGWAEMDRLRRLLPRPVRERLAMTSLLQAVIEAGRLTVQAVPYAGEWGEVDCPGDLALYDAAAADHRGEKVTT